MLFWIFEGVCFGLPILALICHICKAVQEDREAARKAAEKAKAAEEKRLEKSRERRRESAEEARKGSRPASGWQTEEATGNAARCGAEDTGLCR